MAGKSSVPRWQGRMEWALQRPAQVGERPCMLARAGPGHVLGTTHTSQHGEGPSDAPVPSQSELRPDSARQSRHGSVSPQAPLCLSQEAPWVSARGFVSREVAHLVASGTH